MRTEIKHDSEVIRMAEMLDWRPQFVVGYLQDIWSWASNNTEDGLVRNVTMSTLCRVFDADFVRSMADVNWLIETNEGVMFPYFDRWNGQSAKKRLRDSHRKREERGKKRTLSDPDVTMSPPKRDHRTEQNRTEENKSARASSGKFVNPPEEWGPKAKALWTAWLETWTARNRGQHPPELTQVQWLQALAGETQKNISGILTLSAEKNNGRLVKDWYYQNLESQPRPQQELPEF